MAGEAQGVRAQNLVIRPNFGKSAKANAGPFQSKITRLRRLVAALASNLEDLELSRYAPPSVEDGIDFYEEVTRFQRFVIIRALRHTGGQQMKAAALLKMKPTTLNAKIKHLKIKF